MSYRIFELPPTLWKNGVPSIQFLCSRGHKATAMGRLYLAKNFAFSGTPPESYALLQTFASFAWHGELATDYSGTTAIVDLKIGMTIQLDGADLLLEETSDFDAINGKHWLIIDDEIMFIARHTLHAPGLFQLSVIRGQHGTPVQDHKTGAEIFIIRAKDFAPIPFNYLLAGNKAKFQMTLGVQQLAHQMPFEHTFSAAFSAPLDKPLKNSLSITAAGALQYHDGKMWLSCS